MEIFPDELFPDKITHIFHVIMKSCSHKYKSWMPSCTTEIKAALEYKLPSNRSRIFLKNINRSRGSYSKKYGICKWISVNIFNCNKKASLICFFSRMGKFYKKDTLLHRSWGSIWNNGKNQHINITAGIGYT